jgi:predicted GIY-YIG superfamily endonuclease
MREEKRYYVYIMASRSLTLYTGVTKHLPTRVAAQSTRNRRLHKEVPH